MDEKSHFKVPFLGGFREVRRGHEQVLSVHDNALGVQAGALQGIGFQRTGVKEHLGKPSVLGPLRVAEPIRKPPDNFPVSRGIPLATLNVEEHSDSQFRQFVHPVGQSLKDALALIDSVPCNHDCLFPVWGLHGP
jgi:hypothetical protein